MSLPRRLGSRAAFPRPRGKSGDMLAHVRIALRRLVSYVMLALPSPIVGPPSALRTPTGAFPEMEADAAAAH